MRCVWGRDYSEEVLAGALLAGLNVALGVLGLIIAAHVAAPLALVALTALAVAAEVGPVVLPGTSCSSRPRARRHCGSRENTN